MFRTVPATTRFPDGPVARTVSSSPRLSPGSVATSMMKKTSGTATSVPTGWVVRDSAGIANLTAATAAHAQVPTPAHVDTIAVLRAAFPEMTDPRRDVALDVVLSRRHARPGADRSQAALATRLAADLRVVHRTEDAVIRCGEEARRWERPCAFIDVTAFVEISIAEIEPERARITVTLKRPARGIPAYFAHFKELELRCAGGAWVVHRVLLQGST